MKILALDVMVDSTKFAVLEDGKIIATGRLKKPFRVVINSFEIPNCDTLIDCFGVHVSDYKKLSKQRGYKLAKGHNFCPVMHHSGVFMYQPNEDCLGKYSDCIAMCKQYYAYVRN